ncbi:hypothetical protein HMPREF0731_2703, partial [Pseudoroseomonas cervicalis ATCC 49957]
RGKGGGGSPPRRAQPRRPWSQAARRDSCTASALVMPISRSMRSSSSARCCRVSIMRSSCRSVAIQPTGRAPRGLRRATGQGEAEPSWADMTGGLSSAGGC